MVIRSIITFIFRSFSFLWKWLPIILLAIAVGLLVFWGIGYTNRGKTIEKQNGQLAKLSVEVSRLRQVVTQADSNYRQSQKAYQQSILRIQREVSGERTGQIRGRVRRQLNRLPDPAPVDTVSGYTTDEERQIAIDLSELSLLRKQRDTTDRARAVYTALVNTTGTLVRERIEQEINKKRFLGIGKRKALRKLQSDIDTLIRSTPTL